MLEKILNNQYAQVVLALIILLNKSLINGYPLLEASTGRLIKAGIESNLLNDQEGFYVFFVKYSSLSISLWFVVVIQGLILLYGLNQLYKIHLNNNVTVKFISLILLVTFSSIDYYTSLISQHVFALISIVYTYLFLKENKLNFYYLIILLLCLILVPIQSIIILVIGLISLIYSWKKYYSRSFFLLSTSAISILIVCLLYNKYEGEYYFQKNQSVNLIARAYDREIASEFVKEKCKKGPYRIYSTNYCESNQHITHINSQAFKYDKTSPMFTGNCIEVSRSSCWKVKRKEYDTMIGEMKQNDKYLNLLRLAWMSSAIKQIFFYEHKSLDAIKYKDVIKAHYNYDLAAFNSSLQMKRNMSFTKDSLIEVLVVTIAFMFFLYRFLINRKKYLVPFSMVFGILVINAFIVTYFQSSSPYFQGRLISIVSLLSVITICKSQLFSSFIDNLSKFNK